MKNLDLIIVLHGQFKDKEKGHIQVEYCHNFYGKTFSVFDGQTSRRICWRHIPFLTFFAIDSLFYFPCSLEPKVYRNTEIER